MNKNKENNKAIILCDDPEKRKKNIDSFVHKFKKDHKELMDRLANDD